VILTSGVKAGDTVVVDGQEKLRNGSRVHPTPATNPNGPRAVNPNRANTGVGPGSADQNSSQPSSQGRAGGKQP
jgi:multidrug efflux system membrane fusion protein